MSQYQKEIHSRGKNSSQRLTLKERSLNDIKERVDQISTSMKQSQNLLKSKYDSLPQTPDRQKNLNYSHRLASDSMRLNFDESEIKARTPPKKHSPDKWEKSKTNDPLSEFFNDLGLEDLLPIFIENQISYEDLHYLTKDDLIDMNVPIGPRNRLFNAISSIQDNPKVYTQPKNSHISPKRLKLKDEVDQFMSELAQLSKRNDSRDRPSSRKQSIADTSFESTQSQRSYESLKNMLLDISEKQEIMMKMIQESQRAIAILAKNQNILLTSSMPSAKSPGKTNIK